MSFSWSVLRGPALSVPMLFLMSCANQIPPEGGPVDTVPPVIVSTYPAPYMLHFTGNRIVLEFDKYMEHRSVEESIFISPYVGDLTFDWSGTEVEITFSEKLRRNKTYVVNIGTDAKDIRNRNRMAQAFTLAFSTGDDIDHAAIRGRVFPLKAGDPPEGIMIFAYQLSDLDADTLNPRTLKPDYITQTGKNGEFFLRFLAFGPYRILAVKDEYRNLLYDPEIDQFAVPPSEIVLTPTDTLHDNVLLHMALEDATAPRLVKSEPHDVHHVMVEFSESIDTSSVFPLEVFITDTLAKQQLRTYSVFPNLPKLSSFTVVTESQDSTKGYLLTVRNARDIVGLPISQRANSLSFMGGSTADSLAPKILGVTVRDSTREVVLKPSFTIQFSDAMQQQSFKNAITLKDSSGNEIPMSLGWLSNAALKVMPQQELLGKCWYRLAIDTYNALDWSGRKLRDSLRVVRFETLDPEALSSIEGIVIDYDTTDTQGIIYIDADAADAKEQKSFSTTARSDGTFTVSHLDQGRYVVHAFRDRNANGKYDSGRPFPFVRSERFTYGSDTLKVRARWPLEGVTLQLR